MQKEYKTWNLKQIIMYIKIRNGMKEYIKNNEPNTITYWFIKRLGIWNDAFGNWKHYC